MKSWFGRHPNVTLIACVCLSFAAFWQAHDARTTAGRVWLYFCFAVWSVNAYRAWDRS